MSKIENKVLLDSFGHVMLTLVLTASYDQKSLVTPCFQFCSSNEQNDAIDDVVRTLMALSMAPFGLLGQDDWNKLYHDCFWSCDTSVGIM